MSPERKPALKRRTELHPVEALAAAANETTTAPAAAPASERPTGESVGKVQLNVAVTSAVRGRAQRGALTLGAREGRRIGLAELVTAALEEYLDKHGL
ncbi:hypothetical protein CLV35_0237 [Motilibacter peucedani]|uniref:Uncharacterized protein n=1 Tax=Motilibacter peucedani TaxID=598650 RepID=A0A420XUZ4_9ACTN|nr:hypothetical protein [Motilibacter peucedani]RKS80648.1 hypothetical protein CLV35_0237 [Motilibacter peucedani]